MISFRLFAVLLKALLALCKDTAACKAFCSSLITSGNSLFLSFGFNDSLPVTKGVKPSQVLDLAIQLSSSSVNSRTSLLKSWPERRQDKCPYRELQRRSCGYSPFVHEPPPKSCHERGFDFKLGNFAIFSFDDSVLLGDKTQ